MIKKNIANNNYCNNNSNSKEQSNTEVDDESN